MTVYGYAIVAVVGVGEGGTRAHRAQAYHHGKHEERMRESS